MRRIVFLVIVGMTIVSCDRKSSTTVVQLQDTIAVVEESQDLDNIVSNDDYRSVNYDSLQNTLEAPAVNANIEHVTQQQTQSTSVGNAQSTNSRISREYQLGYQNGYDDGEEDAYYGDGWEASFDDSNRYSGKKKDDYELGYLEGYEAGYDDNFEGTDD